MKKIIIKHVIPYTSMATTLTFIVSAIYNIIHKTEVSFFSEWLIIILGIFIIYSFQFCIIERIEFRHYIVYYILTYLLWYVGLGTIMVLTHFIGLHFQSILLYTVTMTGIYAMLYRYSDMQNKVIANEINSLIDKH